MGGVPLNAFKQIKESLKSIFKRKKKGDKNNAQAAEQKPEDAAGAGAGAATTETTATHEAPAAESQGMSYHIAPITPFHNRMLMIHMQLLQPRVRHNRRLASPRVPRYQSKGSTMIMKRLFRHPCPKSRP
ncbi:hypothetical protein BDV41DRAFT_532960 [Aspergillus transmontanensis]|uniref:Uncharacterized protein n=1 Tax=Aspergillus transmontanensis TaxID=1034304 RepID=A0A5N6W1X0_9EURO|nr:hypothetical protein BDV41DRAFT_532960 [Aspergillus transmontanensis]